MEQKKQLIKIIQRFLKADEETSKNYYYACLGALEITTAVDNYQKDKIFNDLGSCKKWNEVFAIFEKLEIKLKMEIIYA